MIHQTIFSIPKWLDNSITPRSHYDRISRSKNKNNVTRYGEKFLQLPFHNNRVAVPFLIERASRFSPKEHKFSLEEEPSCTLVFPGKWKWNEEGGKVVRVNCEHADVTISRRRRRRRKGGGDSSAGRTALKFTTSGSFLS